MKSEKELQVKSENMMCSSFKEYYDMVYTILYNINVLKPRLNNDEVIALTKEIILEAQTTSKADIISKRLREVFE